MVSATARWSVRRHRMTDQKGFGDAIGGVLTGEGMSIYGGAGRSLFGDASGIWVSSNPS